MKMYFQFNKEIILFLIFQLLIKCQIISIIKFNDKSMNLI